MSQGDITSTSRTNRFSKASSFKSSGVDGWKTMKTRETNNRFSNSNRGYNSLNNQKRMEKNEFNSSDSDFPTLGLGPNLSIKNSQNSLDYSNAINEDIEIHKRNQKPIQKKFVSLVSLKKKKQFVDDEFEQDFERETDYVETTYFTDEEEYYEDPEKIRQAEEDYDY